MNNLKELKIEIIKKCPMNCLHCSTESNYSEEDFIEYFKIKEICNSGKSLGLNSISISGGEPLLHKNIFDIISYLYSNKLDLSLYTTGCADINMQGAMDKSFAKKLYISGLRKAIFSIYGDNQENHEYYTRTINSFNSTLKAVKELTMVGIKCEFHFVPLKSNYKNLVEIYKLAKYLNIEKISLLRFVPQGRGELIKNETLDKSDNCELINIVNSLNKNNSVQIRMGSPYNILLIDKVPCNAAIDRCVIDPKGNVYPCDAFKNIDILQSDDNIYKEELINIWTNSKHLNRIRMEKSNYSEICKICSSFAKCGSGCFAQKCIYHNKIKNNERDPLCLNN